MPDTVAGRDFYHSSEDGHIVTTRLENAEAYKKVFAHSATSLKESAPAACTYRPTQEKN